MQVDPIKPTLKAPATKRLKPLYNESSSNFAFKINMRRYIEARLAAVRKIGVVNLLAKADDADKVRRCRLNRCNPRSNRLELCS